MKRLLYDRIKKMLATGETEMGWFRNATDFYVESYSEENDVIICKCIYIEDGKLITTSISIPSESNPNEDTSGAFRAALLEAANWVENVNENEREVLSYGDARESVVDRIFKKYKDLI